MRTLSAILLAIVFIDAAVLYAAEEPPAEVAPQPDLSDDQTAEEMLAAEAALEAQEAAAASEANENNAADPAADTAEADVPSPGVGDEDFVPSIQISEDLSVSFPVDI